MITENYIKMCEANEDLQGEYIPIWSLVLVKPCWAINIKTWGVVTCAANEPRYCDVFMNGNQYGGIEMKDIIYLPTQEQLIKIHFNWYLQRYKGKMSIFEYFLYLHEFALIAEESEYKYYTPKEMMMGYLYQEKYSKEWTGKKWIIIN